jgi:3D (Asp-Asp-Asp) domain-containing protein
MKNTLIRGTIAKSPFFKFFPILFITVLFALSFAILFHPYARAADEEISFEDSTSVQNSRTMNSILFNTTESTNKDFLYTPVPTIKLSLINLDDSTIGKIFTRSTNKEHILTLANLEHLLNKEKYYIQPVELEKEIEDNSTIEISIFTIEYSTETVIEEIEYEKEKSNTDSLYKGNEKVIQKGEHGEKEITIMYGYANGKEISKKIINEKIIKDPVKEIKEVGTKARPGRSSIYQHPPKTTTINGNQITYCGVINVKATSYDRNCLGCNGKGITSTGTKLRKGIIAANTRYIPYNTEFYVPGYGYGKVLDTGSLGSRHLDLGYWDFKQDKANWSTRNLNVYVLCK